MIDLTTVYRTYTTKRGKVNALAGIDLHIDTGEFVVVQGPSGCGKSTLLWTIGAMLRPTSGRVVVDGRDLYAQKAAERNSFRAEHIGFVFQSSHLLPYLSLRNNICLGQLHKTSEDEVDALLNCPECGHEWAPASSSGEASPQYRDANGNPLADGDTVTVIKDLKIKGTSQVVKVGTKVKNIRLVEGDHDIDCKIDGVGAMKLKSEFVRKI